MSLSRKITALACALGLVFASATLASAGCRLVNIGTALIFKCTADDVGSVSLDVTRSSAIANADAVSSQLSLFSLPKQGGRASGNGPSGIGVWVSGGFTNLDNTAPGRRFDGPLYNGMVGVDEQFGRLTLGVGVGVESMDLKTDYNAGKLQYDGFSLTPYASYAITNDLVLDGSIGYTWLDYTIHDTATGPAPRGTMNAGRLATAVNLTKYFMFDRLLLGLKAGTMYLNEHQGSFRVNNVNYDSTTVYSWQGSLGLRALYDLGQWRPNGGATFSRDFSKSGGHDDSDNWGADFDLGLTYSPCPSLSFSASGLFGLRENLTKAGASLSIRYDF